MLFRSAYSFSSSVDQNDITITSKTFEINLFENIAISENGNDDNRVTGLPNEKHILLNENLVISTDDEKINFIIKPSLNNIFATTSKSLLPNYPNTYSREYLTSSAPILLSIDNYFVNSLNFDDASNVLQEISLQLDQILKNNSFKIGRAHV